MSCCLLVLAVGSANADNDKLDIDINDTWDATGERLLNACTDPPQIIEVTDGTHHFTMKGTKIFDAEGHVYNGWDMNIHMNHQGMKGVGYDIKLDDNGDPVMEGGQYVKATDEEGNFIETEYSLPGMMNFNSNVPGDDNFTETSINITFMCNLISHGSAPNLLLHFNGRVILNDDGEVVEWVNENYWAKCSGAGPDGNSVVDCNEWPDFCARPGGIPAS
jgi:hypothetical protein